MNQKEENFLFSNLKYVPQVTLLAMSKNAFKLAINSYLKKIICQKQFCLNDNLCKNCQKLNDNCYFDLNWYKFNKNNFMKKQDVINIINVLSVQSLENNNPKICVIEEIEFASKEANSIFLKFLENVPNNTFLIFSSTNIERVLPTIKSRCQIFNLNNQIINNQKKLNLFNNEVILFDSSFKIIIELINKFIDYDNNQRFNDNFFLIKELSNLKEKIILFFQFLLFITEKKIVSIEDTNSINIENQVVKKILENWKNNNKTFLINLVEVLIEVNNKFNHVRNINLNLLLNYFFISIYQG